VKKDQTEGALGALDAPGADDTPDETHGGPLDTNDGHLQELLDTVIDVTEALIEAVVPTIGRKAANELRQKLFEARP
jgi:hypothetical protein